MTAARAAVRIGNKCLGAMRRMATWLRLAFWMGPQEQAAQRRLDEAQAAGTVRSLEEAEALSDAVWAARRRDWSAL